MYSTNAVFQFDSLYLFIKHFTNADFSLTNAL